MTPPRPTSTAPADVRRPRPRSPCCAAASVRPRPSALSASLTFGWRAMLKIKHVPEQLFDVTVFPIMMTLMFTYLFGGALAGSTGRVPAVPAARHPRDERRHDHDVHRRRRSTPTSRRASSTASARCRSGGPSAMVGALLGDVLRYILASTVIIAASAWSSASAPTAASSAWSPAWRCCWSSRSPSRWVWTMFGLMLRTEKSVMGVSMMVLFPLTFVSNVFVDPATMPGWLQAFVEVNPITHLVAAVRGLMAGDCRRWRRSPGC